MTSSQRQLRAGGGPSARGVLRRIARALQDLHDEQVSAWTIVFRSFRVQ